MKKGLMLAENSYLNMDSIVQWWSDGHSIHIATFLTDGEPLVIITDISKHPSTYTHLVKVNELHSIKRELNEYMGLSRKNSSVSVE